MNEYLLNITIAFYISRLIIKLQKLKLDDDDKSLCITFKTICYDCF